MSAPNESVAGTLSLDRLEAIVKRFEAGWLTGAQPRIDDFLPADGPNRRGLLIELIHADLEMRFKGGEAVRIEGYLQRYGELVGGPRAIVDLAVCEFELRRSASLGVEEYQRRFPSLQESAGRIAPAARPAPSPGPLAIDTVESLSLLLRDGPILEPRQVEELGRIQVGFTEPKGLARELMQRGWLTAFQINQLFQGKAGDLTLGPYLLLERLGQGGMGQVFKARHLLMKRVVAIKLIRKDRLGDTEAVRRFQREIRAVAQLQHPNIVMAFDAASVGDVHFLAMEYVEGADLSKVVKKSGPLSIAQACNYVRQAALGLQHAHERGLVHRDVKPANLLLTTVKSISNAQGVEAVVKVLDLGLARLHEAVGEQGADDRTVEGAVMGTPDYIAPEQAQDSSKADSRADVYSLGATLYFLLAAQPPFPGGSLAQKLLRHQQAQPTPVTELRKDVPPALQAVLARMMAKLPDERYQTPGAVALALELFAGMSPPVALLVTAAERQNITGRPPEAVLVTLAPVGPAPMALCVAEAEDTPLLERTVAFQPAEQNRLPAAADEKRPRWAARAARGGWAWCRRRPVLAALVGVGLLLPLLWLIIGPKPVQTRPDSRSVLERKKPEDVPELHRPKWLPSGVELVAVLGERRVLHAKGISALAVTRDGKLAATSGDDTRLVLVETETLCAIDELPTPGVACHALAFSPDGSLLAGCAPSSTTVFVWDVKGKVPVRRLEGHTQGVRTLAFLPDGKRLLTGGDDKTIRIWDLEKDEEIDTFKTHRNAVMALAAAPDGEHVVSAEGVDFDLLVWNLKSKQVWNLKSKQVVKRQGHTDAVLQLLFSSYGQRLVSVGVGHQDGTRWWDFASRTEEGKMVNGVAAAFSPDGKRLLIARSNEIFLFELAKPPLRLRGWSGVSGPVAALANGKFLCADRHSLQMLNPDQEAFALPYVGHRRPVRFIRFDPSGERLFSQGDDYRLLEWSLKTGKVTTQAELSVPLADEVRWSRDRSLVLLSHVVSGKLAFTVRDVVKKLDLRTLTSVTGDVLGQGFISGDNKEITTIHNNGVLRRWSIASGTPLGHSEFGPPGQTWSGLTWSADGSKFTVRGQGLTALVYDVNEGKCLRQWTLKSDAVRLVVSDDGKRAFAGTDNNHIDVYDLSKEPVEWVHNTLGLHRVPVRQLYPSPDGKRLVSVDDSSHVVIWNTATWKMEVEWDHKPRVAHLAWAPDSRHLAIANETLAIEVLQLPPAK